jgi:hypothetical protein
MSRLCGLCVVVVRYPIQYSTVQDRLPDTWDRCSCDLDLEALLGATANKLQTNSIKHSHLLYSSTDCIQAYFVQYVDYFPSSKFPGKSDACEWTRGKRNKGLTLSSCSVVQYLALKIWPRSHHYQTYAGIVADMPGH